MLRGARQAAAKTAARRMVPVIVFSIGGKAFAMKAAEVGSVEAWPVSMPIPSATPHIREVVRRGRRLHGVYDLAGHWAIQPSEGTPLCVMVKWGHEEVAIRVDSRIPSLESADLAMIRPAPDAKGGTIGIWTLQGVDVPLVSFMQMAARLSQAA